MKFWVLGLSLLIGYSGGANELLSQVWLRRVKSATGKPIYLKAMLAGEDYVI
jgi:hypothetical protein